MTVRKKATRKKTTRKKTTRKKAARKTSRSETVRKKAAELLGEEFPKSLKALSSQVRRDLNAIEKQIETARVGTRRSLTRIVRDASHQLGSLEAHGQKEWRAMSARARNEVQRTVQRVRRAAKRQ